MLNQTNYIKVIKQAVGRKKFRCASRDELYEIIKTEIETKQNIKVVPIFLNNILDQICQQIIEVNISNNINWIPNFKTVEKRDEFYDELVKEIEVPEEYKPMWNQYNYLLNIPQPAQRTKEWFELRNGMITASSSAQAIGESKYDKPDKLVLEKIGMGEKFRENMYVHHGKKYEKIATMLYENIYNVKIGEFGLIPHKTINFLGASPDGIAMNTTLDGQFSPLVGRMLEIKCPMTREIKTEGKEDDGICPHYYWTQVQQQLECCDLDDCDFWQCNIKECNIDDWKQDVVTVHTEGQNQKINVDKKITKGIVIQLLPKLPKLERYEKTEWYSKYIYPPKLKFDSDEEYIQWIDDIKSNYMKYYPDIAKDYYFDKPLYWRLMSSHNFLIKRDKTWFATVLPKLTALWDRVLMYRENEEERDKFIKSKIKPKKGVEDMFSD